MIQTVMTVLYKNTVNRRANNVMSQYRSLYLFMGVLLALVLFIPGQGMNAAQAAEAAGVVPPHMQSVRAQQHTFIRSLPWFGMVESPQSIDLVARASGRVIAIKVEDESAVHTGDLLIELGGVEVAATSENLGKQVASANASIQASRKTLMIRKQMLNERLSNKELLNTATQAVAQAQSQLSAAKQALATFANAIHIKAAATGVFTARNVHPGQYVTAGTLLGRIVNPGFVRIRASLFPPFGLLLKGLPVVIHSMNGKGTAARIASVMPVRSFEGAAQVWIEGDHLGGLAPGQSVSGSVIQTFQAIAVPDAAIARDDQGQGYLFVKTESGYRKQQVETGLHEQGLVEVVSGVKEGERVIVDNSYELLYQEFSKMYRAPD